MVIDSNDSSMKNKVYQKYYIIYGEWDTLHTAHWNVHTILLQFNL